MSKSVTKSFKAGIAAISLAALLVGCGGGGGGGSSEVGGASSSTGSTGSGSGNSSGQGGSGGKTASLSWNAPATRVNGDGLKMGDLQGYVILYGRDADELSERVEVNSASTMDYTIGNLGDGEWFFAIQVVDNSGLTSAPSEVVSKSI